jgi:hypothetical protein
MLANMTLLPAGSALAPALLQLVATQGMPHTSVAVHQLEDCGMLKVHLHWVRQAPLMQRWQKETARVARNMPAAARSA